MRKSMSLFCFLAIAMAVSVASADIVTLPGSGNFSPGPPAQENFSFPEDITGINSVTVDLTYADSDAVAQRPLVLIAGPAGSQLVFVDGAPSGALSGTYTFVETGGLDPILGGNDTSAGIHNAVVWNVASTSADGWNIQFLGDPSGSYSNISIDFSTASAVPEPSGVLAILGVAGLAVARRRRR